MKYNIGRDEHQRALPVRCPEGEHETLADAIVDAQSRTKIEAEDWCRHLSELSESDIREAKEEEIY